VAVNEEPTGSDSGDEVPDYSASLGTLESTQRLQRRRRGYHRDELDVRRADSVDVVWASGGYASFACWGRPLVAGAVNGLLVVQRAGTPHPDRGCGTPHGAQSEVAPRTRVW